MAQYILSCCSTADLTHEHFTKRDIHYICFHYFMDDVAYPDDLGQTMPFDKFYQADNSHKQEGNGLGLALVKRILTFENGSVYAENLETGGAKFVVKLQLK